MNAVESTEKMRLSRAGHAKNPYIHGLRGILSFSLYLFHVANSNLPTFQGSGFDLLNFFLLSLEHGVELFFGISGIVIFIAYGDSKGPFQFLLNRMTRIYPVLWVTTLIVLALLIANGEYRYGLWESLVIVAANFLAMPPLVKIKLIHPAAWSLAYEFCFYLMFVAFGLLTRVVRRHWALCLVIVFAAAFLAAYPRGWMFVSGLFIAMLLPWSRLRDTPLLNAPGFLMALALMGWHAAFMRAHEAGFPRPAIWNLAQDGWTLSLFLGAFVFGSVGLAGVFLGRGWFAKMLLTRVVQWLGTISYSLYLWQTITMAVTKHIMHEAGLVPMLGPWSQLAFFILALPGTLLASHLSQIFLEVRLVRVLRLWAAAYRSRFATAST